jgi:flagellar protein FlbT
MSLRLSLRPAERVIIGGAVIRNGGYRATLRIENEVPVLRESDILSPGAVTTPCQRVYLALQLLYVDPAHAAQHLDTFHTLAAEVAEAAPSCRRLLAPVEEHVSSGRLYQALKSARRLLDHERGLIADVR